MLAVHARVVIAADDAQRRIALELRFLLDPIDALCKRDFVSARRHAVSAFRRKESVTAHSPPARLMGERQIVFAAPPSAERRLQAARRRRFRRCAPESRRSHTRSCW